MKCIWLLLLSTLFNSVIAQDTAIHPLNNGAYLKSYFTNGIQLVISPFHWQKRHWIVAGSTAALSTGFYLADLEINKPMIRWHASANQTFDKIGNAIGPEALIGSSLLVLGTGIITRQPGITSFAQDNLQAQLYTGGICYFAKIFFGREVPEGNKQYWAGPFQFSRKYQSFFSGHTSIAFATATSIYLHSHKKWWVGLISYGVATGVGISRMQRQAHWASDVFVAGVVGTAVSSFVYDQSQKRRKTAGIKLLP